MENLSHTLTLAELARLRAHYDSDAVVALKVAATGAAHPPLAPWAAAIRDVFFGASSLPPRERELCIITLLAYRAPTVSLATHVYAGLMEGLSVDEICQAVGLSGCYGGLPAYTEAIGVIRKTLGVLKRVAALPTPDSRSALTEIVAALAASLE